MTMPNADPAAPRSPLLTPSDPVCPWAGQVGTHDDNGHPRCRVESLGPAADRTGLSVRTLRRRIAAGHLPAYRSGRRVLRVDPSDGDRLMVRLPTV